MINLFITKYSISMLLIWSNRFSSYVNYSVHNGYHILSTQSNFLINKCHFMFIFEVKLNHIPLYIYIYGWRERETEREFLPYTYNPPSMYVDNSEQGNL